MSPFNFFSFFFVCKVGPLSIQLLTCHDWTGFSALFVLTFIFFRVSFKVIKVLVSVYYFFPSLSIPHFCWDSVNNAAIAREKNELYGTGRGSVSENYEEVRYLPLALKR